MVWETAFAADEGVERPFVGVEHIMRTEASPRPLRIHVVRIDLTAPGIRFKLTPPARTRETVRQTTLAMTDAAGKASVVNTPSDDADGRAVGSNLAVFANPAPANRAGR